MNKSALSLTLLSILFLSAFECSRTITAEKIGQGLIGKTAAGCKDDLVIVEAKDGWKS